MAKLPDDDLPDLPDVPDAPLTPEVPASFGAVDDPATLRKMTRRTSWFGRIVYLLIVAGAIALGVVFWQRSKAEEARWTVWEQAQEAPSREEFLRRITDDLGKTSFDDVKIQYITKINQYRYEGAVPALIAALGDDNQAVRGEAALALAAIGLPAAAPAKPKLLEMLPKTNIAQEAKLVWALAVLGEGSAADKIIAAFSDGRLQQQPGFDPKVIVDVVGIARLGGMTEHEKLAVRTLVAQALSEAATPEAVEPLIKLLDDPEPEVVRAAASGLGRTGDPRAAAPLFALIGRQPSLRQSVLDAIRKTTGVKGLVPLVASATDASLKLDLVRMLRDTHDGAAADTLAGYLADADADVKATAALGLAELGDARAVPVLLELARDADESRAQNAIDALRAMRAQAAGPQLASMLGSFPSRTAALLRAIAASGNQAACGAVWARVHPEGVRGEDVDDTETALISAGELRCPAEFRKALDLLKRPRNVDYSQPSLATETSYRNRSKAAEALGFWGNPAAIAPLRAVVEDTADDRRVRYAAAVSVGRLADEATLREVIGKIRDSSVDEDTRRFYVQALWQRPQRALVRDLMALFGLQGVPPEVQRAAALAVGYSGDASIDGELVQMLGDPSKRREAAFAISLGGTRETGLALVRVLAEDRDLREVMTLAYMATDNDDLHVITEDMFESGAIWRRITVARAMHEGEGEGQRRKSFTVAWTKLLERLKLGWSGPGGATARFIREKLYEKLVGSDAEMRRMAAEVLGEMNERGLLFKARDAGGPGAEEARVKIRDMNSAGTGGARR